VGTEVELQLRLDEARKATIEAQKTLLGTTQVIYLLLQMVTSLQGRCEVLERERDRAVARASSLPEVQRELAETQQKAAAVEEKLKRARQTREEAEELNVTAEVTAAQHELALEQARADTAEADDSDKNPAEETPRTANGETASVVKKLRPLWEYDAALEAAEQKIEAHQATLGVLRAQMGITPDADNNVLQGVVVRDGLADNDTPAEDAVTAQEAAPQRGASGPVPGFARSAGSPLDITEVKNPAAGRLCLGALYVPEVLGVRLHFGLLNGHPVGLIAEIGDYQFEMRLRLGRRDTGSWKSVYLNQARQDLTQRGPVTGWHDPHQLLPGWGPAITTQNSTPITVAGTKQPYHVIITGCDGPGWVLQLTCFTPSKLNSSVEERQAFHLLRIMLRETVVAPGGPMEAAHYVLRRPRPRPAPAPARDGYTPVFRPATPPPVTGSGGGFGLSADSADRPAVRHPVRTTSEGPAAATRPHTVAAPRWIVVAKDTAVAISMFLWMGSLATALAYRQQAVRSFLWDGVLTNLWASALFLASTVLCGLLLSIGNFPLMQQGAVHNTSANTSCLILMTTGVLTLVCAIIAVINPDLLPLLSTWGKTLSDNLLS